MLTWIGRWTTPSTGTGTETRLRPGEIEAEIIRHRPWHPGDDKDDETGGDARP
jgi:hypothetical protein